MVKIVKSLFFAILFSVLVFGKVAQAQTINAASCSSTDVQAAFNSVTATTTTVKIPGCPAGVGWSAQVSLNVPSGSTTLSIIGAGNLSTTGGGDQKHEQVATHSWAIPRDRRSLTCAWPPRRASLPVARKPSSSNDAG